MKKIKLKTIMAGPRGSHGIGCTLTVGEHINAETAKELVDTNQAEEVKTVNAKAKTVDAPKKETDEKPETVETPKKEEPASRKSAGKKPRGR